MKMRIALATLAGAATLAVTGVAAAAATAPNTAPAAAKATTQAVAVPATCSTGQLSAGFHGNQAQGSYRGFLVTLTNTSNTSCTVKGYVSLRLLNAWHQPLYTKTINGKTLFAADPGAAPIVLSPGETASADIGFYSYGRVFPWRAGTLFPPYSLRAAYLRVTAPSAFGSFTLRIPNGPASVFLGRMYVTAMASHTPYTHGVVFPWR